MHLSFIMDGNRRWAKKHLLQTFLGHEEWRLRVEEMIELCYNEWVEYCSFWALAKKNLENRSKEELSYLFDIFVRSLEELTGKLLEKGIIFEWIGNPDILPAHIVELLESTREKAKNGTKMTFILAIGYGGQDEIIRGIRKFIQEWWDIETLDESSFLSYIDTGRFQAPDLIIRTGWDIRSSGCFLYQSEYSEYYFTQTLWPDFREKEFYQALASLEGAKRNFGK